MIEWKEPDKLKVFDKPLLCWTSNCKFLIINETGYSKTYWKEIVDKYDIIYWTYQEDIRPHTDSKEE